MKLAANCHKTLKLSRVSFDASAHCNIHTLLKFIHGFLSKFLVNFYGEVDRLRTGGSQSVGYIENRKRQPFVPSDRQVDRKHCLNIKPNKRFPTTVRFTTSSEVWFSISCLPRTTRHP